MDGVIEIAMKLGHMDQKLDEVLRLLRGNGNVMGINGNHQASRAEIDPAERALTSMTVKQHATLQMLLNGKSNQDIAERLHVTENTAKVHVRLVARKAHANKRQQIVAFFKRAFDDMDDSTYQAVTGGLPKDWDANWGSGTEVHDHLLTSTAD